MVFLTIFMLVLSVVSCGWAAYQMDKARKHQEMNMVITEGLDELLNAAKTEVTRNKKLVEKAREVIGGGTSTKFDASSVGSMDDPGMLATIITVLVNRFGTLRLGINDFNAIQDNEYVSVYMDTSTNELLLSLEHNLEKGTGTIMDAMNFGSKDDGTFH